MSWIKQNPGLSIVIFGTIVFILGTFIVPPYLAVPIMIAAAMIIGIGSNRVPVSEVMWLYVLGAMMLVAGKIFPGDKSIFAIILGFALIVYTIIKISKRKPI